MCVICIKPIGAALPKTEYFRNAMVNNPHGAGYMFAAANTVKIRKGFWDTNELLKELKTDLEMFKTAEEEVPIIFHARIGTSGLNKAENCHPFPLSNVVHDLQNVNMLCKTGIAHNGILGSPKGNLSDTQLFIKHTLSKLVYKQLSKNPFKGLIGHAIKTDKLVALNYNGAFTTWGDWTKDGNLWWSNQSYTYNTGNIWGNEYEFNLYRGYNSYAGWNKYIANKTTSATTDEKTDITTHTATTANGIDVKINLENDKEEETQTQTTIKNHSLTTKDFCDNCGNYEWLKWDEYFKVFLCKKCRKGVENHIY